MNLFKSKELWPQKKAKALSEKLKEQHKTIVFTNGCFDIIHAGHVHYLNEAKKHGDILWIGLNADCSVKQLKGPSRPIHSELARAFVLSQLKSVDYITLFSEDTPLTLIKTIQPHIHIKGGDYKKESLIETPIVESYGGNVIIKPFLEGFSTSSIINKSKLQ